MLKLFWRPQGKINSETEKKKEQSTKTNKEVAMKTIAQVYQTQDYSAFKLLVGNRDLNKEHLSRLKKSMETKYLLAPIVVNDKFEIIDGQHRFESAKELSLPINFIIAQGYSLNEVQQLNTNTSNWHSADFLKAYCDEGRVEYLRFKEYRDAFSDLSLESLLVVLFENIDNQGKFSSTQIFKSGDLKIESYETAYKICSELKDYKTYFKYYSNRLFVYTFLFLRTKQNYNHNRMIQKLKLQPNRLSRCATRSQYLLLLEEIYNYKSQNKVSLIY
jgi:hypothetical protein